MFWINIRLTKKVRDYSIFVQTLKWWKVWYAVPSLRGVSGSVRLSLYYVRPWSVFRDCFWRFLKNFSCSSFIDITWDSSRDITESFLDESYNHLTDYLPGKHSGISPKVVKENSPGVFRGIAFGVRPEIATGIPPRIYSEICYSLRKTSKDLFVEVFRELFQDGLRWFQQKIPQQFSGYSFMDFSEIL